MRVFTLLVCAVLAVAAQAQKPTFSSESRAARLPAASLERIGAEYADFESVRFDAAPLEDFLQDGNDVAAFRLRVGSHSWDIELTPVDIRTDDYLLQVAGPDGVTQLPRSASPTYKGYTTGAKPAEVRLTVRDGLVYGLVAEAGDAVFFQSQWLTDAASPHDALLIFRGSDGKVPDRAGCETMAADEHDDHGGEQHHDDKTTAARKAVCREAQIAIASDFSIYSRYDRSASTVEARNLAVMNTVNSDYAGTFSDDVQFRVSEQFVSTCGSCDPWSATTNPRQFLETFTDWAPRGFQREHDLGQLWSARNLDGTTIGIAWTGVVCRNARYHALEDFSSNPDLTRVLVSHEIGHNFNSNHDASGTAFVMSPSVRNTTTWSQASIRTIDTYIAGASCLTAGNCGVGDDPGGPTPVLPVASFSGGPYEICAGQTVAFQNRSTSATSYSWSLPGATPSSSTRTNPSVSYNAPGRCDVTLVATNADGSDTEVRRGYVTVVERPTANFAASSAGLEVTFTNQSTGGSSFLWDFGDGFQSTQQSPSHTYRDGGTYFVSLTVIGGCGNATIRQSVFLDPAPEASFTSSTSEGCGPLQVRFESQTSVPVTSYNWTFPGGTPATSREARPLVVYNDPGTYDVRLSVSGQSGTDEVASRGFITVNEAVTAGFGVSLDGTLVQVADQSTGSTSVRYTFGDGTSSNNSNAQHFYGAPGVYTITQVATGPCGTATTTQQVTIEGAPEVDFDVSTQICLGENVSISSQVDEPVLELTYVVTLPDGRTITSDVDPLNFEATLRGEYGVSLTVTTAGGTSTSSDPRAFTVLAQPTASISQSLNGLRVRLTAQLDPLLNGADIRYQWDYGDGTGSVGRRVDHTYAQAGNYTATLTAFNGCETVTTSTEISIGDVPAVTVSTTADDVSCAGTTIRYAASTSADVTSVTWNLPGASNPSPTGAEVEVDYERAGRYSASVEVCNGQGCARAFLDRDIVVQTAPAAGFDLEVRSGNQIKITDASRRGETLAYSFGEGSSSTEDSPLFTYTTPGTYTITQEVSNRCGSDTETSDVTIGELPTANFTIATSADALCEGGSIQLVNTSANAERYVWSFPGGSPSTSNEAAPQVTFAESGRYDVSLTVTNQLGQDELTRRAVVVVGASPTADFDFEVESFNVSFDAEAGAETTHRWDFGDGTSSTRPNPAHRYAAPGDYTVTHRVVNDCGSESTSSEVRISSGPPQAAFVTSNANGCGPLTTEFSAAGSVNAEQFQWLFPGGSPASAVGTDVAVTYRRAGVYEVQLIVLNESGADTLRRPSAVRVASAPELVRRVPVIAGFEVDLQVSLIGAVDVTWDFGDGTVRESAAPVQVYTYGAPGRYVATASATNDCGTTTERFEIVIGAAPDAAFEVGTQESCAPFEVNLTDQTTGNPSTWAWVVSGPAGSTFTSDVQNPAFTLTEPGTYDVVLQTGNDVGSSTEVRLGLLTVLPDPAAAASITAQNELRIELLAEVSNVDSLRWDFGDGATSVNPTPAHTYAAPGQYTVVLRAFGQCGIVEQVLEVELMTSDVGDLPTGSSLSFFPNPVQSVATLEGSGFSAEPMRYSVLDAEGREVASGDLGASGAFRQNLTFGHLAPGTYQLVIRSTTVTHASSFVKLR